VSIELSRVPTEEEIEAVCGAAEEAARRFIQSKLPLKRLDDMEITVEAIGDKPLALSVEIAVDTGTDDPSLAGVVENATDAALAAADAKVQELGLCKVSSS